MGLGMDWGLEYLGEGGWSTWEWVWTRVRVCWKLVTPNANPTFSRVSIRVRGRAKLRKSDGWGSGYG